MLVDRPHWKVKYVPQVLSSVFGRLIYFKRWRSSYVPPSQCPFIPADNISENTQVEFSFVICLQAISFVIVWVDQVTENAKLLI